jgi:excisionase family DNA binding protein
MTAPSQPVAVHQGLSASEELLTVPQVMARLQLGRSAVYDLLRSRRLGSVTIGRSRRIPQTALLIYLTALLEDAS